MNRIQTESITSECVKVALFWQCTSVYSLTENSGWIDLFQVPVYKSDGNELLQIQSHLSGGRHYQHLALINIVGQVTTDFLTDGDFVVTRIYGWDETINTIYFQGTGLGAPGERHLYSVGDSVGSTVTCITCTQDMPAAGAPCQYSSLYFSPDLKNYVQTCYGPEIPEVVLRDATTNTVSDVLENNDELRDKLVGKLLAERQYTTIPVPNNFEAPVRMLLPPGYDVGQKYPALVDVYGGPGSQEVNPRWSVGWGDYLSTNYDVIYISIDNRGTGFQSNEFLFELYTKLGTVEMQDQISVMQALEAQYPFIDVDRTGIWGWSYGGYATLMTLIQDTQDVFKCGNSTYN